MLNIKALLQQRTFIEKLRVDNYAVLILIINTKIQVYGIMIKK